MEKPTLSFHKLAILTLLVILAPFARLKAQTSATTVSTTNNVVVSYTVGSCQGKSVLFLKFENNDAAVKTVTYSFFGAAAKTVTVQPAESAEGGCSITQQSLNESIPTGQTIANLNPVITVN